MVAATDKVAVNTGRLEINHKEQKNDKEEIDGGV